MELLKRSPVPTAVVVDDTPGFALRLEPALREFDYETLALGLDPGAADEIERRVPDLVLVRLDDLRRRGIALIRELRRRPALDGLSIIAYVGKLDRDVARDGREAGATLVVSGAALEGALPEVLERWRARLDGMPALFDAWPVG